MDGADCKAMGTSDNEKMVVSDWPGSKYDLSHCDNRKAKGSYDEAMKHLRTNKQRSVETQFRVMYRRFVNGQRMSRGSLVKEAALTGTGGRNGGKDLHFYAFKKIPVRSYFWYSPTVTRNVWVSHYLFKDFDDLSAKDTQKVRNKFQSIEGY